MLKIFYIFGVIYACNLVSGYCEECANLSRENVSQMGIDQGMKELRQIFAEGTNDRLFQCMDRLQRQTIYAITNRPDSQILAICVKTRGSGSCIDICLVVTESRIYKLQEEFRGRGSKLSVQDTPKNIGVEIERLKDAIPEYVPDDGTVVMDGASGLCTLRMEESQFKSFVFVHAFNQRNRMTMAYVAFYDKLAALPEKEVISDTLTPLGIIDQRQTYWPTEKNR